MPEPKPQKQLCQIRLMFAVDSDDEAIAVKKQLSELLKDQPEIQVNFSLTNAPPMPKT